MALDKEDRMIPLKKGIKNIDYMFRNSTSIEDFIIQYQDNESFLGRIIMDSMSSVMKCCIKNYIRSLKDIMYHNERPWYIMDISTLTSKYWNKL